MKPFSISCRQHETSIGKNIALMVVAALLLLLGLGALDENKHLLMPSYTEYTKNTPVLGVIPKGKADEPGMLGAIAQFNRALSLTYLSLDPAPLASYPLADDVRQSYIEELAFLKNDGRALELTANNVRIDRVERLSVDSYRVETLESVTAKYLSTTDRKEIGAYPATGYVMSYVVKKFPDGWKVMQADTAKVDKRDE